MVTSKERQKQHARKHYLANRELMIERSRIRNIRDLERNRNYVKQYLIKHPCMDCGESDPIVLEFDHIKDDKIDNISGMVLKLRSIAVIQKEIDKCEVRCANCHRRVTYYRRHKIMEGGQEVKAPL